MAKQKNIEVVITSLDKIKSAPICYPSGWGEKSEEVHVSGKIAQIEIDYDNKLFLSIRILEDGSVHLTTDCMTTMFPRDVRLTNERKWK